MKHHEKPARRFDVDSGYLVKNPCRDCGTYERFPACLDRCATIDRLQTALTAILPTASNSSGNYTVLYEGTAGSS
jgi:hypothetical protein